MNDLSSNRTRRALAVSFLSVALASCGGGDPASETLQTVRTIENALGSLSQGLAVETEAPAHQVTHSRFIRRMRAEHANNNPLAAKALLDSLMWHVGDLRKYGAIPDEYAVPLNTALHYVAQLYGTGRAENARQLGDPPVTAAEFASAVAQLRALVAATRQGSTPRAALMLVTEDSTGCNTMGEIGEDIGVVLVAGLKSIPKAGQLFGALTSIFWPIDCTKSATNALQDQLNALKANIGTVNWNIYNGFFNTLKGPAFTYRDTVQFSSDAPSILRDLRAALTVYLDQKDVLRATGTSDYSAAAAVPLYASYVTQYITLLQDYIQNAAAGGECGTASKWCDPLETDAGRNQQMCAWKKELLRVTYDYAPNDPDPKIMTQSECFDELKNPTSEFEIYKSDSAKQFVIATIKNGTGLIPEATVSTSKPNLKMLTWNARNAWTRVTTLSSQDPAMYWPWMNILTYPPTTDPNDPTATIANVAIPAVLLTRELYSDIIGTIRDKEINNLYSWIYMPDHPGLNNAQDWLDKIVTVYRDRPVFGPLTFVDMPANHGYCLIGCANFGGRVWDIKTTQGSSLFPGFLSTATPGVPNPGGTNDGSFYSGITSIVGIPRDCDYDSDAARWSAEACVLALGKAGRIVPLYEFQAAVVTDQDKYPNYGISKLEFWFIDNSSTGDHPAFNGTDSQLDGHYYAAAPLSGDIGTTNKFSLPRHIISSITPFGTTPADGLGAKSLSAFIVGYRPYDAWAFPN